MNGARNKQAEQATVVSIKLEGVRQSVFEMPNATTKASSHIAYAFDIRIGVPPPVLGMQALFQPSLLATL